MLSDLELQKKTDKLQIYDVVQSGWEQEGNGFEANVFHVLTHLNSNIFGKDFTDEKTVKSEIAPDSLQYAIRLGRWTGNSAKDILGANVDSSIDRLTFRKIGSIPMHYVAYEEATYKLTTHLHDLGHKKERDRAIAARSETMAAASRLLIHSAILQSEEFDFDLLSSFDTRLSELRLRFKIPEPI